MRKSTRVALGLLTTTVVLATTLQLPSSSEAPGAVEVSRKVLTDVEIGTMAPAAQAALLDPLRAAAGALSEVGGDVAADVFTSVEIDANHGVVNLYLTDKTRAAGVIQRAKSAQPSIDTTLSCIRRIRRIRRIHDGPFLYQGSPRQAKSDACNNVKWHDSSPFIGDVITNGSKHCTTGLPAVRKSDGRPVMVTAAQCFRLGERVFTGAGRTWSWSNGLRGNYVGTVRSRNQGWDAELIVGANNNADESDVNR